MEEVKPPIVFPLIIPFPPLHFLIPLIQPFTPDGPDIRLAHELEAAVGPFEPADEAKDGGSDGEYDGLTEVRGVP